MTALKMILNSVFYLTFLLFSLGQLGRVSFFGQQLNVYLYEILVVLGILALFVKYDLKPLKESFKKFRIVYIFFFFLLLSYLLGLKDYKPLENFIGLMYSLRLILYFFYFFYLEYHFKHHLKFERTLVKALAVFVVLTLITSVVQYFSYPDLRNLLYAGWDPHLYRLFGTFLDTSVAGAVYGLIFLILYLKGEDLIKNKSILISLLAIFFIFIVLTYSRSSYIALMIITILISIGRKWYKKLFILMC